jgi:hypothetical protein
MERSLWRKLSIPPARNLSIVAIFLAIERI